MCDYSLMNLPNRLAVEGEQLVVHRFPSGSKGLASPADLAPKVDARRSLWRAIKELLNPETCSTPAVCIPPSTRLELHDIGEHMRRAYGLQPEEPCVFEQLSAEANTYRDALRFQNGCRVRLQDVPEGQRVTVLDAPPADYEAPLTDWSREPVEVPLVHR